MCWEQFHGGQLILLTLHQNSTTLALQRSKKKANNTIGKEDEEQVNWFLGFSMIGSFEQNSLMPNQMF